MKGHLHHIEIYVSNLDQSKAFWGWLLELLGYSIYQVWDKGFSYRLEEQYLVFVQVDVTHLLPSYHRKNIGLNHLAFYGESVEFIDHLYHLLKQKGITILYEDRYPNAGGNGHYAVYFEDPDRIKVEVIGARKNDII